MVNLGKMLLSCLGAKHEVHGLGRDQLDITDESQCLKVLKALNPDVIIHSAAYTAVDLAETEEAISLSS